MLFRTRISVQDEKLIGIGFGCKHWSVWKRKGDRVEAISLRPLEGKAAAASLPVLTKPLKMNTTKKDSHLSSGGFEGLETSWNSYRCT